MWACISSDDRGKAHSPFPPACQHATDHIHNPSSTCLRILHALPLLPHYCPGVVAVCMCVVPSMLLLCMYLLTCCVCVESVSLRNKSASTDLDMFWSAFAFLVPVKSTTGILSCKSWQTTWLDKLTKPYPTIHLENWTCQWGSAIAKTFSNIAQDTDWSHGTHSMAQSDTASPTFQNCTSLSIPARSRARFSSNLVHL